MAPCPSILTGVLAILNIPTQNSPLPVNGPAKTGVAAIVIASAARVESSACFLMSAFSLCASTEAHHVLEGSP
jgi:hypothetical protein